MSYADIARAHLAAGEVDEELMRFVGYREVVEAAQAATDAPEAEPSLADAIQKAAADAERNQAETEEGGDGGSE